MRRALRADFRIEAARTLPSDTPSDPSSPIRASAVIFSVMGSTRSPFSQRSELLARSEKLPSSTNRRSEGRVLPDTVTSGSSFGTSASCVSAGSSEASSSSTILVEEGVFLGPADACAFSNFRPISRGNLRSAAAAIRSSGRSSFTPLESASSSRTDSRSSICGAARRKPRAAATSISISSRSTMSCQNLYLSPPLRGAIDANVSSMLRRV